MTKPKFLGMKKLAAEFGNLAANLWIRNRVVASAAVGLIADDRVFYPGEMHPDLVSSSGL